MKKRILKIGITLVVIAALVVIGRQAYIALTDQSHIDETFYQVESDKLVSDVRLVVLSDLHLSEFGPDNSYLVYRVTRLNPDLIIIAGDMNTRKIDDYSVVLSLCRQLKEIAPTYYGLGNHEVSRMLNSERDIYYDLCDTGISVLHNIWEKVTVGKNTLCLAGVSQHAEDIAKYSGGIIEALAEQDDFKVLISHYPSNFEYIYPHDIDLVLSGHLHGGQINLPYFDGLYSADDGFFPDYTEGQFEENGTIMIVSRGLGNSSRLPRVNNNPELVIVDLGASTTSFNTMRLLSVYDNEQMYIAQMSPQGHDSLDTEGTMLELMRRREAENLKLSDEALKANTEDDSHNDSDAQ